jgi:hypothetical protein
MAALNNYEMELNAERQISAWKRKTEQVVIPVPPQARHSGKDYRGIWSNPAEIVDQFSGDIPLGRYGYGQPVDQPAGEDDVRLHRYMIALLESELLTTHVRITGPTASGKSIFLQRLATQLLLNHDWSIVWFSTKLEDDLEFFDDLNVDYTVISANNIPLTRRTGGRLNPLDRISIRHGRVDTQDCLKIAEALINLIPIDNITSDEVQKFVRHTCVLLSAILELLKYHYGNSATLDQVIEAWVILPDTSDITHPLNRLLQANCVPSEVQHRLRKDLTFLLQPQRAADAIIGVTAQQLLAQINALGSVFSANDIPNFSQHLRERPHVLVVDQSDGLNACVSKGLARSLFPFLYEELVAKSPHDWKAKNLCPVLMVIDEMNSVYTGNEFSDFLEKSRSKGVILAFGQQSSVGSSDPRLNAAMSNNTRIQVIFSGCDSNDPQVRDLNAAAGSFTPTLDPHLNEPGFLSQERLPVDAIVSLGPHGSLVRIKSTTHQNRIMWVDQSNMLVPHRAEIRALRDHLADRIYECHQGVAEPELSELCYLYAYTKQLLLYSYGYWRTDELRTAFASLNLEAISQSYNRTARTLEQRSQTARGKMALDVSAPEFTRNHLASLNLAQQEREWQVRFHQVTSNENRLYERACQYEADVWQLFLGQCLPQIQDHRFWFSRDPIKKPELRWWHGLFGIHFSNQFGSHAHAVLKKYQEYAEAYGRINPDVWRMIEPLVRLRVTGFTSDIPLIPGRSTSNLLSENPLSRLP